MTYVRNAWYVATWVQDLESDKPTAVTILDEPIALWRADGRLVAFEDRCVHRLAPLSLGRCEGASLRCMYHGMVYGADGKVSEIPGQDLIPAKARVRTYPVVEKHSWVWIWMGDPAFADESLIPPAVGFDNPDYILGRGTLDYEAEARLIMDNLLDFSHVSYLHTQSFNAGSAFADNQPKLEVIPRGVRYTRWLVNAEGLVGRKPGVMVDTFTCNDYLLPGIMLIWAGSFPVGTAERCNFGMPDYSEAVAGVNFTSHAATPTSGKNTRYFYSWGPHRAHGDEKVRDLLVKIGTKAFLEDKVMIEGQQKVIDRSPGATIMPTAHDQGVTIYNRMVEKLAREERVRRSEAA